MDEQNSQELDFTPVEGDRPVPLGWRLLFWGLIAFGAIYLWRYTPAFTGWTQAAGLDGAAGGSGTNILATVVFTVVAVLTAVGLLFSLARRKG
ncbi:MAG TPA: cbb3-type cytochrome c oxidase N-terminal domain-containing protein [Anaeromyxobacter sp.]|nr:cbb3-type cytochrome c oxidase N-terminal domain-containing protein [Anaeromyxobacter sp.]